MPHGHSHNCGDEHNHNDDTLEAGVEYSLFKKINLDNVECLNEVTEGSGKTIFKAWENRRDESGYVESDVDEELLISIPFSGLIKLKGIVLIGGEGASQPKYMKLFKNNNKMDFDNCQGTPAQIFELASGTNEYIEYTTNAAKFSSIHHLTIYFPENFGAESTKLSYIGLRGEFMGELRDQIVIATYEARPVPQDHKGEIKEPNMRPVS